MEKTGSLLSVESTEESDQSGKRSGDRYLSAAEFRARLFSPLRGAPKQRFNLAFDTENWSDGRFRMGVITDGNRYWRCDTQESFKWELAAKRFDGAYFWAHNLMYDLCNIFGQEIPGESCLINKSLYFATLKFGARLVTCSDTTRHCPKTLASIGESIGLPKLGQDLGSHIDKLSDDECYEYCARDALIVWRFVEELQRAYNSLGCQLNYTIGSTALDLFRRRYMTRSYVQLDPDDLDTLNQSYYGGRCEAFVVQRLKGPLYMGDVKSMYPSVMRDLVVPIPDRAHLHHQKPGSVELLKMEGASECTVLVRPMMYPPLPYRWEGKLLFPIGTFRAWWSHNELRYAVTQGVSILVVHETLWFDATCEPFRDYVDDLYAFRGRGEWQNLVGKLVSNNLYGKFGQCRPPERLFSWEHYNQLRLERGESGDIDLQPAEELYDRDGNPVAVIVASRDKVYPKHSNQIWASYITAGARIKLHGLLLRHKALYCDTDSILTRDEIVETEELGGLSLQHTVSSATVLAPKVYQLECDRKVTKVKGVPGKSGFYRERTTNKIKPTNDVKCRAFRGDLVYYARPMRLMESFRRAGKLPWIHKTANGYELIEESIDSGPNIWHIRHKFLHLQNTKRRLLKGGETLPLCIGGFVWPSAK